MAWRGPRTANDPILTSAAWRNLRAELKIEWGWQRLPCARCGKAIDYEASYFLPNGKVNRRALAVGHKISRRRAKLLGRPELHLQRTNLQPEHASCSQRSGAQEGSYAQRHPVRYSTSGRW